jgi:hypothetical protein
MSLVITGAKAFIKLSGEALAFAAGVSVTHENKLEEIPELDRLEVAEYAENGHRCSISISSIKLASTAEIGGTKIANNAQFYNLDFADDLRQILLQPEIIIEIVEAVPVRDGNGKIVDFSEKAIYVAYGCKFEGGTGQLDARGIWQGTWNFKCRRGVGI